MSLSTLLFAVGGCHLMMALLLLFNRARTTKLALDPAPPAPPPSVLIVVPARNEEPNIEACVRSLLSQDYPRLTVRVVDDHSTDRTAALVQALADRDPRLQLCHAPTLPPGWLGKPHALHAGTQGAEADFLLFCDADLRLQPDAVRRTVEVAERTQAGLTTLVPTLVAESFWERAVQPVVGMLLFSLLDPVKVRNPRSKVAAAYGPYLMFRRSAYEQIGGHTCVASEVIEDLRLAHIVKGAGIPLAYVHGVDGLEVRMYDSLRGLINGWRKNFYISLGSAQWLAPIAALLILTVFALPTVGALGVGLASLFTAVSPKLVQAAAFCYGADWAARLALARAFRITPRGIRSLGGLMVAYILCLSAYQAARRLPVTWRGRSYSAAPNS